MNKDNIFSGDLSAPEVDHLVYIAKNSYEVIDDKTRNIVMELFDKLQSIASCGDDQLKELWLRAPRGNIEDFGDYDEYLEDGQVESREEFYKLWQSEYPFEESWYLLIATIYNDYY